MGLLDWGILVLLALGAWQGFRHGFLQEVSQVVGLIIAFIAGVLFMQPVGQAVSLSLGLSPRVGPLVGFLLVFVLGLSLIAVLGKAIQWLLGVTRLGVVNRLLGGIVGGVKVLLLLSAFFWLLDTWRLVPERWKEQAMLYAPVKYTGAWLWVQARTLWPQLQEFAERVTEFLYPAAKNSRGG